MIIRNGKVKLEKGDICVGNFVLSVEEQHIKVCDLNKFFILRFRRSMPVGAWLLHLIRMGDAGRDSIKTYIAVLWSALSVVPDDDYLQDLIGAAKAGLSRHPEWYGKKDGGGDE